MKDQFYDPAIFTIPLIAESLHPHEFQVLKTLEELNSAHLLNEEDIAEKTSLAPDQVRAALGRLQLKKLISILAEKTARVVSLSHTGKEYVRVSSPLARIFVAVRDAAQDGRTLSIRDIAGSDPASTSAAIGELKQEQTIRIVEGGRVELITPSSKITDCVQTLLSKLQHGPLPFDEFTTEERRVIEKFAQRRGKSTEPFRIDERVIGRTYNVTQDGKAVIQQLKGHVRNEAVQLTPQMLKDGSWRNVRFRKYTIGLRPERKSIGKKHPYREFLDVVKAKFVGMGFEEMRGPLVENEFWDMDALFMPQFHPARNIHDVYFLKSPTHSAPLPETLLKQVQQTHERGWKTGSTGWRYSFDPMRTRRLVLRSQGTAVSARTLAGKPKVPGKYFSIARCFRYDQVDATHAADFYQIEGIVLGLDINFRTLLGLLKLFGEEIAQAQEIRFLPAYFPFTEPSVELHVRHPRLGWMELGGAGLFRPEVTRPLEVDVPVIAWGLGLDRMAMVALEIHDIRDLFSADLEMIRSKRVQY